MPKIGRIDGGFWNNNQCTNIKSEELVPDVYYCENCQVRTATFDLLFCAASCVDSLDVWFVRMWTAVFSCLIIIVSVCAGFLVGF